jgi:hypothetical protein
MKTRKRLEQKILKLVKTEVSRIMNVSQTVSPHYSKDVSTIPTTNEYLNTSNTNDFISKKVLFTNEEGRFFRKLLATCKVEELLAELTKRVEAEGSREQKVTVSILSWEWHKLESERIKGIISHENHSNNQSSLVERILGFINVYALTAE